MAGEVDINSGDLSRVCYADTDLGFSLLVNHAYFCLLACFRWMELSFFLCFTYDQGR